MSQPLFSTGKVGVFLEAITHKMEKRKGGEAKVIALRCRIHPFTVQHALAINDVVRGSLFKRSGAGDPLAHVRGVEFALPLERQNVDVYASPDTSEPTIRFEQVKVSHLQAKTEKGSDGYACSFLLTFGPVTKNELEFVEAWRTSQRFLSFEQSEPDLGFDLPSSQDDEAVDEAQGTLV